MRISKQDCYNKAPNNKASFGDKESHKLIKHLTKTEVKYGKLFWKRELTERHTNSTYPILQKSCWKQKSKEEREKSSTLVKRFRRI